MTAAFVVTLEIPDGQNLDLVAEEILDELSGTYEVVQVNPWARPSAQPPSPIAPPPDSDSVGLF